MLLYAMLYGTMPFDGHDFRTLRRQITNGLLHQPAVLSGLLSAFIKSLCVLCRKDDTITCFGVNEMLKCIYKLQEAGTVDSFQQHSPSFRLILRNTYLSIKHTDILVLLAYTCNVIEAVADLKFLLN